MTGFIPNRNVLIHWSVMVLVLVLLYAGVTVVLDQQRERLLEDARHRAHDDLSLIRSYVHEALQKGDYQVINGLLQEWGAKQRGIERISLTTANGLLLGYYQQSHSAVDTYDVSEQIPYSYTGMGTLELTRDLDGINRQLARLRGQLLTAVVLIGVVLWIIIWLAIRHHSEAASLRASTLELDQTNARLQKEMVQHRRTQTALSENEAQLRLTLENALIGIASVSTDGHLLNVNPAFCKIMDYPAEELLQMQVTDLTHPDDCEALLDHYRNIRNDEIVPNELQKRCIRKDGATIDVLARVGAVRGTQGELLQFVVEVEDVTERRRTEQEMQRMRNYLQNIVNSMPSILVGVNNEGRVTEWNKSAENTTGVPTGKAIGQPFSKLFPELESQLDNMQEAIRINTPMRTERLITEKNGEPRYSDVMIYPLLANEPAGAVIRIDDITNRVRIEQMMVQTEKMMSVGGLAAGMAHEINNPLSGVLQSSQNIQRRLSTDLESNRLTAEALGVNLELLYRYLDERGILDFLDAIQQSANRASLIVADMLAYSRATSTEFQPALVGEMLDTVVRLATNDYDLKKKYDFKQVEIVRDYDPEFETLVCDHTEIEQVLLNLIKNAAQAMAEGATPTPHRIILRTRREGEYGRIEVQDNGPGMNEQTQRRVFEPFFTTKTVGVGTGLGLSVSYFIITEQHKGTMSVAATPGEGACFTIRLPLHGRQTA